MRLASVLALVLAACQSAGSTADWGTIEAEILEGYEGVILDAEYVAADNFLIVAVSSGTTQFGATQIACERVLPVLQRHDAGDVVFAVYVPGEGVTATGSHC